MTAIRAGASIGKHVLKARAYGLCALWLSDNTSGPAAREAERELAQVLATLGLAPEPNGNGSPGPGTDSGRLKPFRRGSISPHETGHDAGTGAAGGMTFVLADIAGFYRAFGFQVAGERPDHIVPELEFMALLHVKEAYALASSDEDGARVCADARRKFVQEHLGVWLPRLSQRIDEQVPGSALAAIARSLMALSASEP